MPGAKARWRQTGVCRLCAFLRKRRGPLNWVLAAAVVILFAAGFISYVRNHQVGNQVRSAQVATPIEGSATQIEKDNELMSQVNSEIAEAVPAPMQPLQISQSAASNASAAK